MPDDPIAFGRRLKRARKALGLTQVALAERAHIFPQSISRYERGRIPDREELIRLAHAVGWDLQELLTGMAPRGVGHGRAEEEHGYQHTPKGEEHAREYAGRAAPEPRPDPRELMKDIEYILDAGDEDIIGALLSNLKAFKKAARALRRHADRKPDPGRRRKGGIA